MTTRQLLVGLALAVALGGSLGAAAASGDQSSDPEVTAAPQVTKVPDVVGFAPPKANRILTRHHLRHRYTALSNLCAGIPPAGHILLQDPRAGATVEWGSIVKLQTSCAPSHPR